MHRTIEITMPPAHTDTLIHELEQLEHVINLSVVRGASIKPPGAEGVAPFDAGTGRQRDREGTSLTGALPGSEFGGRRDLA